MGLFERLNRPILGRHVRLPGTRWRVLSTLAALLVIGGGLLLFLAPPPGCSDPAPISGQSREGAYHVFYRAGVDVERQVATAGERWGVEPVIALRSLSRMSVVATRRQITRMRCDPDVERIEAL